MAYSDPEKQKSYHQEWYRKNKERLKAKAAKNNRKYKERNREYFSKYKLERGCTSCSYAKNSAALDFHHPNDDKEFSVASRVNSSHSIEYILKEVEKCIVLCANCHRVEHSSCLKEEQ